MAEKKAEKEEKTEKKDELIPISREEKAIRDMFFDMVREMEDFRRSFFDLFSPWYELHRPWWSFPEHRLLDIFEEFGGVAKPATDLIDRGDAFEVVLDIPGIPKENLEINVTEKEVEIRGNFETNKEEKKKKYVKRERTAARIYRNITLPAEIIPDKVTAKMENGILRITLPKQNPTEPKVRKVKIE